jgi:AraC-like DNA-binding protein
MNIMLQGYFLFVFIKNMYRVYSNNTQSFENAKSLLVLFNIIFLSWVLLKALHAPEIFRGIDSKIQRLGKITENEKANSTIKKQVDELELYMATKEPFLDSDLTIQNLAMQLDKSVRELSILINYHFNQHFYNFINTYRINKAKKILKKPSSKNLTISEIFYNVGFNSKSSFNTAFKKQVGITPTEYRKNSNYS